MVFVTAANRNIRVDTEAAASVEESSYEAFLCFLISCFIPTTVAMADVPQSEHFPHDFLSYRD